MLRTTLTYKMTALAARDAMGVEVHGTRQASKNAIKGAGMKLRTKIIGVAACAFALCVALAGCASAPAGNDAANFQGDWILSSGTVDGQEATEETMAQAQEMGLSVYLQLNEGGSAVLSVLGTNMDGSWTAKDATTVELTFDGSSAEATLEGEELVMQQDGDVMRFKRGEIPPVASEVQRDENQAAELEA